MRTIEVETWKRKEYFELFSTFEEPFFGIVSEIECDKGYKFAKSNKISFFAYYLYCSLKAANEIEEFHTRIHDGNVVYYDLIHASPTIGRADNSFAFSFIKYNDDFNIFISELNKEIDAVKNSTGLRINEHTMRKDTIHFSSIPWIKITGLSHARNFRFEDSMPKISFGKMCDENNKKIMGVTINAHHGLMDGYHASEFIMKFQNIMNKGF